MEWSRVKNILIVLLAIVNVFLFIVYLSTTVEDAKGNEQLVLNTVSILQKNGITVNSGVIPVNNPVLYPATGKFADKVLDIVCTDGRFTAPAEGDIVNLSRRAGISILKESEASAYITVNGLPVYNGKITYDGKNFEGIAIEEVKTVSGNTPQGVCGILVSAISYIPKGEIQSVTQGYVYEARGTEEVYLLPVWCITTTEGTVFADAMTGEKVEY
ncbi:MAG: hypothetical protein IKU84_06335 [Clostridia bacterium]|nr:hypothetical protein [Clostridia bacterium]